MVPDRQRACSLITSEILPEPTNLGRAILAATHFFAHGVEDHHVPLSQVIAVVAFGGVARCCTKVVEVAGSSFRTVTVVARSRLCTRLVSTPGRGVAVLKLGVGSPCVDVVTRSEHRSLDAIYDLSS